MLTDYKISSMLEADGKLTVKVRFYEGSQTTEGEKDHRTNALVPVTRYRRTKMVKEKVFELNAGDDIHAFLKAELKKDKKRSPIPQQA